MTEIEARGYIQGKLNCMNKCDVFERERSDNTDLCDNCEYCYSQGNFGQQKEAFEFAINALEKQIPKKPIVEYKNTNDCITEIEWKCPICGTNYIELAPCGEWCNYCGQKLDWSNVEWLTQTE